MTVHGKGLDKGDTRGVWRPSAYLRSLGSDAGTSPAEPWSPEWPQPYWSLHHLTLSFLSVKWGRGAVARSSPSRLLLTAWHSHVCPSLWPELPQPSAASSRAWHRPGAHGVLFM